MQEVSLSIRLTSRKQCWPSNVETHFGVGPPTLTALSAPVVDPLVARRRLWQWTPLPWVLALMQEEAVG